MMLLLFFVMRPNLCVVLSGGGSRGAFQVGALKELLKHTTPDCVIGTSVGALNGFFLCSHKSVVGLEHVWSDLDETFLFPLNRKFLWKFSRADSVFKNTNLKRLIVNYGVTDFEDLKIPLYVNCTRLSDGKSVFFDKGPLLPVLLASSAVVPFYPPYMIDGKLYVDGGFSEFAGLSKAKALRPDKILLIDSGYAVADSFSGVLEVTRYAWELVAHASLDRALSSFGKDIVHISPSVLDHVHVNDFSHTSEFIREGTLRMREVLDKIL